MTDRNGQKWKRHDGGWCFVGPRLGHRHWRWSELFFRQAPLYDATPEPARAPSVRPEDSTAEDSGTRVVIRGNACCGGDGDEASCEVCR